MTAKEAIRARALELGFAACRCTTAEPPASASRLHDWLAQQRHGEMTWLARNAAKRADPRLVLPGARSVIVLTAAYRGPLEPPRPGPGAGSRGADAGASLVPGSRPESPVSGLRSPPAGFVARYARHADYHHVLAGPLQALTRFVNQLGGPDTRSLWYVDTGPVLERDLAQRAGAGFIGKHTNLISRAHGNWIVLAEILTTLALEPDPPEKNRCGSCTRCIVACPTAAITGPFQLDARRCISYLTIELKGPIPIELRPAVGNRIFGCDDCLEVCPWNRFANEGRLMREVARPDLDSPGLLELLALDDAAFDRRFRGTPLQRAKRRSLRRNVCVALGNVGDTTALPALEKAVLDPDPLVAEHARWAVEQIRSRLVRAAESR